MSGQDPKCGSCAYRVNELRRQITPYEAGATMVCLHKAVVREDCAKVRAQGGACGPDAALWTAHSERSAA